MPRTLSVLLAAAVLSLAAPGCGDDDDEPTPVAPVERTDERPTLPAGWTRVVNGRAGFNFGLPPGWTARGGRGATQIRSFDGALAGSVSADRSDQGLSLPPDAYARRTALNLDAFRNLDVGRPQRVVDVRYPTWSVRATGTLRANGLRQAIIVFALRPRGGANYSFVLFRSARVPARRYAPLLVRIVRSFRTQERIR